MDARKVSLANNSTGWLGFSSTISSSIELEELDMLMELELEKFPPPSPPLPPPPSSPPDEMLEELFPPPLLELEEFPPPSPPLPPPPPPSSLDELDDAGG